MKKQLHLLILLLAPLCIKAQNKVIYGYDAAGNQIKREIVLGTTKSAVEEPSIFTEEFVERIIKIYPNPTQGQLKVEISNIEGIKNCVITITAMNSGKQILKKKATLPVTDIDISNQPFGIYVMLIDIDGEYTSWRIMKKP